MKNFQAVIDAAFGAAPATPSTQMPSDELKERERTFRERANKIETLREVRLPGDRAQEQPISLIIEVVRHRGHWRTLHASRHSSPCSDQAAAILAAKKLAKKKRKLGHPVEVVLRRTDGQSVPQPLDDEAEHPR